MNLSVASARAQTVEVSANVYEQKNIPEKERYALNEWHLLRISKKAKKHVPNLK